MKKYLTIIVIVICASPLFGQEEKFAKPKINFNPEYYICYRSIADIKIDGKFDERSWENSEWSNSFVDIEGDLKPKPYHKTRVKMLWDDLYFYIAAELEEPGVWAKIKQRDEVIFYDNDFEVFIDPDGDTHKYYELEINAFGTEWDLFLIKPYRDADNVALTGWDIKGLKTAVQVNGKINDATSIDEGWCVEIAIPWKALSEVSGVSSPPKEKDQWRVNFSRVQWRTKYENNKYVKVKGADGKSLPEFNWVWSPQGLINLHYPEMWGYVQFSNKVVDFGTDEFIKDPVEAIKWNLRRLYYAEKTYFMNHNKFTDDVNELNLGETEWLKSLSVSDNLFEARAEIKNKIVTIIQDGLVEVKQIKREETE